MSKALDSLRTAVGRESPQVFVGGDPQNFPELTELLMGKVGASGTAWERAPYSLLIYLDATGLTWKIGSGDKRPSLWGHVDGLRDALLAIEDALCKGRFSPKAATSNNNGFTHR